MFYELFHSHDDRQVKNELHDLIAFMVAMAVEIFCKYSACMKINKFYAHQQFIEISTFKWWILHVTHLFTAIRIVVVVIVIIIKFKMPFHLRTHDDSDICMVTCRQKTKDVTWRHDYFIGYTLSLSSCTLVLVLKLAFVLGIMWKFLVWSPLMTCCKATFCILR